MPLIISGATSGSTTIQATDAVTATLTLPSSTGTLVSTANPQSGSVLQVINFAYNTDTSTTSGTFVDSGLVATITPKFSTSKVLVIINTPSRKGTADNAGRLQVTRNGSNILSAYTYLAWNGGSTYAQESYGLTYLDSPATTSATTYKLQFACMNGTTPAFSLNHDGSYSTITLMEIAA